MKRKLTVLLLTLLLLVTTSFAQGGKIKALFLYNFTKYIEWPVNDQKSEFIIGIFDDTEFHKELKEMLTGKKVGTQSIEVINLHSMNDISKCQMLYLPNDKNQIINELIASIGSQNILLVTDKPGLIAKGSGLNFIIDQGKLTYEIKKSNIEKNGLKVSNNLVNMGKAIQ